MAQLKDKIVSDEKPRLFGLSGKSNRDETKRSHWGKNEFNSSFPTALLCYMHAKAIKPVYIKMDNDLKTVHSKIAVPDLFGINPDDENIYFSFEDGYGPFEHLVKGQLERSDLVIMDSENHKNKWKRAFEIKLTALPDNTTYENPDDQQSCEMVFRPNAIIHLALSISFMFQKRKKALLKILSPVCSKIFNWRSKEDVSGLTTNLVEVLNDAFLLLVDKQLPFIVQPIWKTIGKASILHENCLDVFVWSNFAFTRLFLDGYSEEPKEKGMTRSQRCIFWTAKMLYDFAHIGKINPSLIASEMAYELQTDKAFSVSGVKSLSYLKSGELTKPRVNKGQIKKIILGGGQKSLSPERRFDSAVVNTPGLFD